MDDSTNLATVTIKETRPYGDNATFDFALILHGRGGEVVHLLTARASWMSRDRVREQVEAKRVEITAALGLAA